MKRPMKLPGVFQCMAAAFLWCALLPSVFAQVLPLTDDYILRTWEMEDGLPSNTVTGVRRASDGFLWIATP
ncbi:MAG: two-component regulator propeller domain-containing protein [Luteolibacter sp.]